MTQNNSGQFFLEFDGEKADTKLLEFAGIDDKIYIAFFGNIDKSLFLKEFESFVAEKYFEYKMNFSTEDSFEKTVKDVNEHFFAYTGKLNIIFASIADNKIFISQSGEAEAYLIRNDKLNIILESNSSIFEETKKSSSFFINMASGEVFENDLLIFSSKRLLKRFTSMQIINIFRRGVASGLEEIRNIFKNEEETISVIGCNNKNGSIFSETFEEKEKFFNFNGALKNFKNYIDDVLIFVSRKTKINYDNIQKITTSFLVFVIILILILGFFFSKSSTEQIKLKNEFKVNILKIEKQLEVAENKGLLGEIENANSILKKSEKEISAILEEGLFREESILILSKISQLKDDVNRITRFKNVKDKVLVDLSPYLDDGEEILGVFEKNKKKYAYTKNKLLQITLNKLEKTYDFKEGLKIRTIKSSGKEGIIIFTKNNKIFEFNGNTFDEIKTQKNQDLPIFQSVGNYSKFLYFLDKNFSSKKQKGQIWKYLKRGNLFKNKKGYLRGEDINNAISLTVDGSIYLLHKGGYITQYYSGKPVNFLYRGVKDVIKNAISIYTEIDFKNIYLKDLIGNKLIVLKKTKEGASFQRQYVFENFILKDYYLEKDEFNLIISDKSKIYKISLIN